MKSTDWRALVAQRVKVERDAQRGIVPTPLGPPKFCKDCVHHSAQFNREKGKIRHYCSCPPLLDVITGEPSHPATNRNSETLCGREARHFMRRPVIIDQPPAPALEDKRVEDAPRALRTVKSFNDFE